MSMTREAETQRSCGRELWGKVGPLRCVRLVGHSGGHFYRSTTGSELEANKEGAH